MNNEQLAILLQNYQSMVEAEIEKIQDNLPEECFVVARNMLGKEFTYAPILSDIKFFCDDYIGGQIETLLGKKE